ncbi:MAG TPA: hypothetical protein DEF47_19730 [Herpetosiphon sp.]|uniref:hypothetical protein n=1 Tax=Herpetosiphon sp. TaxID=71864 RepID=UPI0002DC048E|nr:hypothetical protein [Herpetosiphon sp.]HBW52123.1 hypothetical protein [Herpetosiphon sp.]
MDAALRKSQRHGNLLLVGLCLLLLLIGMHLGYQLAHSTQQQFRAANPAIKCNYLCKMSISE